MIILAAAALSLAACFLVWDLCAWYREKYQGGSFTTIHGCLSMHLWMVVIYVWVSWAFLKLASQLHPG